MVEKTLCRETTYYHDGIIFEKLHSQSVFCPHENEQVAFPISSGLNNVFKKICLCDELVWMVGLTIEIKLCFRFLWHSVDGEV